MNKIELLTNGALGDNVNYKMQRELTGQIRAGLNVVIDKWMGVNIGGVRKQINSFRDYYKITKRWWDNRKKKLYGQVIWLPVFRNIRKVNLISFICFLYIRYYKNGKCLFFCVWSYYGF